MADDPGKLDQLAHPGESNYGSLHLNQFTQSNGNANPGQNANSSSDPNDPNKSPASPGGNGNYSDDDLLSVALSPAKADGNGAEKRQGTNAGDPDDYNNPAENPNSPAGIPPFCLTNEERFELVDKVIDDIGVGRFHLLLFLTSAISFMVEASEIQLISLLLVQFKKEWNATETQLSIISSATSIGTIIGTVIFGQLSDKIGRKQVFQMSVTICIVFGFISSFAEDVLTYALLRLFMGIGFGGNIISSSTLLIESVPSYVRGTFSALTSFAFTIGYVLSVIFAWEFMDIIGWQWLVRIVSLIGMPALLSLFFVPESVRYCIQSKQYEKCASIVNFIAKHNKVSVPSYFTLERLRGHQDDTEPAQIVTKTKIKPQLVLRQYLKFWLKLLHTQPVLPLSLLWFLNSFAQTSLVFFPLELQIRYPEITDAPYKTALALCIGALCGSFVVVYVSHYIPRRVEFKVGLLVMGVFILIATHVTNSFVVVFISLLCHQIGSALIFHGLYTYTPEIFPTAVRVSCFSICQMAHRFAAVIAPFVFTAIAGHSFAASGTVFAMIYFSGNIVEIFGIDTETFGKPLVEEHNGHTKSSKKQLSAVDPIDLDLQ